MEAVEGRKIKHALILLGVALLFLITAIATLYRLAGTDGWYSNHESDSFMSRTAIYAAHLMQGDLFPIWSGADNLGLGSPQPALYHKLFYLVSGALYAISGAMKTSLLLAIGGWLCIGATGTYLLCRACGCSRSLAAYGGIMLILANYTVTNWLTRGAMAELSAAMLVPWALAAFINTLRANRIQVSLGITLGLIFLAHSVIAYYLVLFFVVVAFIFLQTAQVNRKIFDVKQFILASAAFLIIVAPSMAAMYLLGRDFDMTRIIPSGLQPMSQRHPFNHYLWDRQWTWGRAWEGFTVQLDSPVLVLLALSGFILIGRRVFLGKNTSQGSLLLMPARVLSVIAVIALLLQLSLSAPFYKYVPGAAFLQFPWRLLALLTPVSIALALTLAEQIDSPLVKHAQSFTALAAMFLICGAFAPVQYELLPSYDPSLKHVKFSFFEEYVPKSSNQTIGYEAIPGGQKMPGDGCTVVEVSGSAEALTRQFRVKCDQARQVVIPLFASVAHRVSIKSMNPAKEEMTGLKCAARNDFPALCAVLVPQGDHLVIITMPTLATLF